MFYVHLMVLNKEVGSMRTIFIRWIVIGIGTLAVSLVFLGLHMMSLQYNKNDENARIMAREIRDFIDHVDTDNSKEMKNSGDISQSVKTTMSSGMLKLKQNLIKLAEEIQRAKTHIRGTKARESVTNAMSIMSDLLKLTNTSIKETKRKTQPSKNICGEVYKGTTYGYPFFYKGFETQNCSYAKSINYLVSIVLIYKNSDISELKTILKGIHKYNPAIEVFVGTYTQLKTSFVGNTKYIVYSKSDSDGKILNSLVSNVKTEYVLIGRNITTFNVDARLDRLIREIESLDVTVAGGAARDKDGHWKLGCYQTVYKNYSLVYYEGYDESLHECIFCDYVDASFIIKTKTLTKLKFDVNMNEVSLFFDLFLRLSNEKLESVVCPDSMFYMQKHKKSNKAIDWTLLMEKWQLSRIKYSDEVDISFQCNKHYRCFNGLGYTVTPCCLQELADMVNFIMKTCEENNIICELQEGTLLGAVKLHTVLPWERDADLTFLTANFTAFAKLKDIIMKKYRYIDDKNSVWCCADNRTAGGKIKVNSKNWHIELYGQHIMDSEILLTDGLKPTKALLNGNWVGVPRNPGWHARNRYGHEIYAHAQHWMALGKGDGWINYKTNAFTPCQTPGRHDCLDGFNTDGNMQFGLPIP